MEIPRPLKAAVRPIILFANEESNEVFLFPTEASQISNSECKVGSYRADGIFRGPQSYSATNASIEVLSDYFDFLRSTN